MIYLILHGKSISRSSGIPSDFEYWFFVFHHYSLVSEVLENANINHIMTGLIEQLGINIKYYYFFK